MYIWMINKQQNRESYETKRFFEEAIEQDINLEFVSPEEFDVLITAGEKTVMHNGLYKPLADCMLYRLGAGVTYFGLALIRHFESLGMIVLNQSRAINIARDKLFTLQRLIQHQIPVPKTILAKFPLNIDALEAEFKYPVIIKPVSGSEGKGVFLCENREQLEDMMELIEVTINPRVNLIIQEFVSRSRGRDIRVIVVGGRVIGAMLRTAKEGKFKANYSAGGSVSAFDLDEAVEWLALSSTKAVGLDIAGVDILFDGDQYKVCEVNTSLGFEGFEKATGINIPKEIFHYARLQQQGYLPGIVDE